MKSEVCPPSEGQAKATDHPADLLAELWSALAVGQVPRDEVRAWFCAGVAGAVRQADPLDAALGIAVSGRHSLRRHLQMLARNEYLLEALRTVAIDEEATDWARCVRLAALIQPFVSTAWPRVRNISEPPTDWPAWKRAAFKAARTGATLPTSARALLDVVRTGGGCSPHKRAAKVLAQFLESNTCNPW